ncbi:branched-chain alpha-keto acid dehydrogenase subunit E2 [Frankia sp. CcI156]|nr:MULTISPECIES: dihydrolipoamide acetyltransferase family protein [unclassified Frankia]ETA00732.1 pyruvate/2-oxoglutarate dehydrogenase complex, dihydrolipoamide acyltransferase component [Frankia sp. CcI6]OHV51609.1 branched-chain alpha-keto acid dehydrogenase subunit E2 [Frankia sp. CgIS1]ONH23394.1 branched-chain alpha-keto acid dehydrogenase subunit E2 [Frankia sp. CcI156]ORT47830.1 branched-chain alpha-keto acid dehydrogenase subunit E2 [Frankia sp. KB5]
MAAVREFPLPDLGEGLTSAEVVRWLVGVGDVITVDQPVAEVETAKAVVEVPCPYAGVVTSLAGLAGTSVPVGTPLITVAVSEPAAGRTGSGNILVGYGTSTEPSRTRRRRRVGAPEAPPVPALTPTPGPATPLGPSAQTVVKVVSPLVRRFARENSVDLRKLVGTGPDGLILRKDVESAIAPRSAPSRPAETDSTVVPLDPLARRAAETFARSRREVPDATCWVDTDATALLAAKDTLNDTRNAGGAEPRIGLLAILARICVAALVRFPALNSAVVTDADGRATGVRHHAAVHLGFAAQTPRGLVVPVVHHAQGLTTARLAAEIARLTAAARAGTLTPAELTGGTFTLNNYGVFGVDGSTPIIHHPEAAMIGIGRIVPRPWAVDGELAVRRIVQLSFTFDHRVCDGATAGSFLRFVADAVEDPTVLLRHL